MKNGSSSKPSVTVIRWIARITGTFFVLFMASIFIGSIIEKGTFTVPHPAHFILLGLWIISSIGILIAWKWEGTGGILGAGGIIISDLLNIFWIQTPKLTGFLIGSLMWLLPSLAFIYCWLKTKEKNHQQ